MILELPDTQSRIPTSRGPSFPYQFGVDIVRRKLVAFNTADNKVETFAPAEIQQRMNDETLDAHRRNFYQAAWEYWQSQMVVKK